MFFSSFLDQSRLLQFWHRMGIHWQGLKTNLKHPGLSFHTFCHLSVSKLSLPPPPWEHQALQTPLFPSSPAFSLQGHDFASASVCQIFQDFQFLFSIKSFWLESKRVSNLEQAETERLGWQQGLPSQISPACGSDLVL